jgi:LacI family transcriptional regulator, galactose operon repressor
MITHMRVRLKDVAKSLGLSITTVHAILHNRPNFNEATRERVLRKIKEMGYQPNWLARSLVTQKTHVCGVVVPNLARSIFPDILDGIDSVTHASGYHLVVSNTREDPEREEEEILTLINKQVDGLIIASSRQPGHNGWKMLESLATPLVLVDRLVADVPFVGADHEQIGFIATKHLIDQGYRSIAHLSRRNIATGVGRFRGYVRALHEAGLRLRRDFVVEVQGESGGYEGTKRLLQMRSRPDAIFAASDPIAVGAMLAIQESGLRMPIDIGIIGAGKTLYGEHLRCPLSTVDQHSVETGKSAASILLKMIEGKPAAKLPAFLEPVLIVRDSSCRVPCPERSVARPRIAASRLVHTQ